MSKKTATITFHWATNYGGVLQAYALQKALEGLGLETEIIDFVPRRVRFMIVADNLLKRRFGEFKKERSIRAFRRSHLKLSKRRYRSTHALLSAADEYGAVIAGSDQVWNYSFITSYGKRPMLSYFLDFTADGVKRLSYAASFGADKMPADYAGMVKPLIDRFAAVSVREDTGLDIMRGMGVEAELVCDPTALLSAEDYARIAAKGEGGAYVCSYIIQSGQHTAYEIERLAARKTGLPINRIKDSYGIPEWLGSIRGAEIVVTNSFHGVMLSLIFGRPFIAVPVEGKDMNARIQNVLRELGQTHRILSSADPERVEELVKEGLDKAAVNAGLERLRAGGMEFLRKNLLG